MTVLLPLFFLFADEGARPPSRQLLAVQRVYIDKLTGGETAAQIRELIIAALENTKLFVITENPDRADAVLRGGAEDLVFTDQFQSQESVSTGAGIGLAGRTPRAGSRLGSLRVGVGENETYNIRERKHEATATVRLVNREGDVIWSTTQESMGGKFRGASADVADKIARQLQAEFEKLRR